MKFVAILLAALQLLQIVGQVIATEFIIRSDRDFLLAINAVRPGDVIQLNRDTKYFLQHVELLRSGYPQAPITLSGDRGTKICSDSGTALVIRGSHWKIQNLAFEDVQEGIIVFGNNNTLKSLSFHNIEEEAVALRGSGNFVKNCVFNGVNHGIIVSGRDNVLHKNSITSISTTVTTSPQSCCGQLEYNVFNGLLKAQGDDYIIMKNVANSDVSILGQRNNVKGNVINGKLDVSGCANQFFGNTAASSKFVSTCYNWDDGENQFGPGFNDGAGNGGYYNNNNGRPNGNYRPNNNQNGAYRPPNNNSGYNRPRP